jgi:hypothetical protein
MPSCSSKNGSAERKHHHIVEVGLALLANASMPFKFWDEAFLTATFLINLLPSKVINHDTPVERLLNTTPNYESLRVFGCACWPNLRPYNKRKLAFRSTRCVFIGYSSRHKGVKCLDPSTGRVYISRDVVFDENLFPFASLNPNAGSRLRQDILLLPTNSSSTSTHGETHIDDYMPLPFVPIVTNDTSADVAPADVPDEQQLTEQNLTENHEEFSSNDDSNNSAQNDESGGRSQEDSPAQSSDRVASTGAADAPGNPPRDRRARSLSPQHVARPAARHVASPVRSPSPARAGHTHPADDSPTVSASASPDATSGSLSAANDDPTDDSHDLSDSAVSSGSSVHTQAEANPAATSNPPPTASLRPRTHLQ